MLRPQQPYPNPLRRGPHHHIPPPQQPHRLPRRNPRRRHFVDHKPDKFIRFSIDNGTEIVLCILWLNQLTSNYYSRRNPSTVRLIAHFANSQFAKGIKIGVMARV
ncbi:hypothetical protein ACFE04_002190 [Oxalis oulophora]